MKKHKPPVPAATSALPNRIYVVKLSSLATKQLDKLPDEAAARIYIALAALADNPRPSGVKKLKGKEGYRIRIGDYRAKYSIFDAVLLVEVVRVGQRGNFYDE